MKRTQAIELPQEEIAKQKEWMAEFAALEDRPRTYCVVTYGCQMNAHDSETLEGMLAEMGMTPASTREEADFVIFNTCCVRDNAQRRALGNVVWLKELKKTRPELMVGVCGCMMQQPGMGEQILKQYPFVDLAFGTHNLYRFAQLMLKAVQSRRRVVEVIQDDEGSIPEDLPVRRSSPYHAYITIMYGCNNFCSYCIVPYVRGRERSRQPADIIAEVRELAAQGYRDITLLGQNVNSYGRDLDAGVDFSDLLSELAQLPGDFLLRFMTSHPKDATKKLFDTMAAHPRIARHIHLPFQAGSDRVLRAMNRGYTAEQYLSLVEYARGVMPDLVLTSDVIVGFPGETEAEFEDTLRLIEQVRYDALFTFLYSPRPGTPAARMPDPASRAEKNAWFSRLCQAQNRISEEKHRAYVGKTLRVLVDGAEDGALTARTEGGRLVRIPGADPALVGTFLNAAITASTTWSLVGSPAD